MHTLLYVCKSSNKVDLTVLFAPNNKRERKNYWIKVGELVQSSNLKKGIIMGDFNTPLVVEDKMGGLTPDWECKEDLSSFINGLAFLDLYLMGGAFTW